MNTPTIRHNEITHPNTHIYIGTDCNKTIDAEKHAFVAAAMKTVPIDKEAGRGPPEYRAAARSVCCLDLFFAQ
jgi:hypothetical protein